jgi:hypothetical protein
LQGPPPARASLDATSAAVPPSEAMQQHEIDLYRWNNTRAIHALVLSYRHRYKRTTDR